MLLILIPAAGGGARFAEAGYDKPKPLIDVLGKPMLRRVMDNLTPERDHHFVVVTREDSDELHAALAMRWMDIVVQTPPTGGAVETILKAEVLVDGPLLIGNCDQLVAFDVDRFIDCAGRADGSLITFKSNLPHHSYVTKSGAYVEEIVEKEVISNEAVTGVYFFQDGSAFMKACRQVIETDIRVKGEFYVSSAISVMLDQGLRFTTYDAPSAMLGTPQELQLFEAAVKVGRAL